MIRRIVALGVCALAALPAAASATDVIGNINVDTRWTPQGSPYVLTGDVTVAPQATLTIEPGVEVRAAATDALGSGNDTGKVELIIRGALLADGKPSQPVIFRGESASLSAWWGISIEPGARASSLTNVQISNAVRALWTRTTNALQLSDLKLSGSTHGLLWQASPGPTLTRVTVESINNTGIQVEDDGATGNTVTVVDSKFIANNVGLSVGNRVAATVRGTHFTINNQGLVALGGSSLTFTNNVVAGNRNKGLVLHQTDANPFSILNNTIDVNNSEPITGLPRPGIGIHVASVSQASVFMVRNNLVTNHGTVGIQVDGGTQPSMDHNNVWGNVTNYQGATAGAGSISANPLYTAPIGWVSVPQSLVWTDSGAAFSASQVFEQPGASKVRLRFGNCNVYGIGHDELRLYNRAGTLLRTYVGTFSGASITVNGDYVRLVYWEDHSGHAGSVRVDGFEYEATAYNYRLKPSSPAIDIGNDLSAPAVDADGTARPYDGDVNGTPTVDIGAYEWHENIAPLAIAGPDQIVLPATQVSFDSTGSRDPDGRIVTWDWDFGDESAHSSAAHPTHTYSSIGTYTVTLTITDDQGASSTDTLTVNVADNLPPTARAGSDQFVDIGQAVSLDGGASTDPDGTIVGYSWDFGDGSPSGSGLAVTHAWAAAGVYTLTLTVTDDRGATSTDTASIVVGSGGGGNVAPVARAGGTYNGAVGAAIQFDGSASSDSDGSIVTYQWDFGDGTGGSGATVSHSYTTGGTYLVRLTVTDNIGATDDDTALVNIAAPGNQAPVADAGGNRSAGVGENVAFDASASSDPDGSIASYAWDFGDNSSANGVAVSHSYTTAGTYLVRLTVTDNVGAVGQDIAVVVVGSPANQAPVARAGGNREAAVGQTIQFDGSASQDSDGTIASYQWSFGDGAQGSGVQVQHAYASAGSYLVRLTVTDNGGATGQDFALVVVGGGDAPANQNPVANAGPDAAANAGDRVIFNASASVDPDGTIISYQWDFGDGGTATGVSASHVYEQGGTFTVTLTVIDDRAARSSDSLRVTINARPVADPGPARSATVGQELSFDGGGSSDSDGTVASYAWDFGDGTRTSGRTATHAYATAGVFAVQLTVTDDKGATGVAVVQIVVNPAQTPPVTPPPGNGGSGGCSAAGGGAAGGAFPALLLGLGILFGRRRRRL